jgi:ATP-dependent helicase/nuclease subunit A
VRDRIRDDLDTNLLIEAGAGSGKTHSLAERMASGIARGRYDVTHMAAVTFTRKAAAELRGRFQLALEQRLDAGPSAEEDARLRQALGHLERFFAGTIHAFCARLLRERPVEARMAPGFAELDEVDDGLRRERAWRDYIVRESARGSQPLRALREAGIRPPDLDSAFARVCDHEDVRFPVTGAEAPDPAPAWSALARFWSAIAAELPDPIDEDTTCKVQKLARTFGDQLAVARRDRPAHLARLLGEWDGAEIVNNRWGDRSSRGNAVAGRVKKLLEAFQQDVLDPFLSAWRAWLYDRAVTVLSDARAFYAEERRRDNVVNYVDLLMVTARLLRENTAVRRALQDKYRWLFIDEFQDTDPIQAEVFLLLAADETKVQDPAASLDWMQVSLRPGALFVVGDPKQSIYRFRRADIDIYTLVRTRLQACGGAVLPLTTNFRSVPDLCAFANAVFPTRFPPTARPEAPAFERLEPVRHTPAATPAIATLTLPAGTDARSSAAVEADRIAAWIRSEVASGRRKYGDVLVLTRNRPRLAQYARVFEHAEIPVEVSGAGMFGGSEEVGWLRDLIAALSDPIDGVALVGLLRGALCGFTDADLFRFRAAGGRFDLTTPLPEAEPAGEAVPLDARFGPVLAAMRHLQRLHRRVRRLPLASALELLLEETGLLAVSAATPGGARAGDLLQAIDRVRQIAECGGGLAEAADALAEDAREATDVEALPLEPGRRDVVRLMNLHKAKGLEATVVFLADPCHGRAFGPEIRIVRGQAAPEGWLPIVRKAEESFAADRVLAAPMDWPGHAQVERRYLDAEEDRLLYVATTRARDLMVVGRSSKPNQNKAWGTLDPFLGAVPELVVPGMRAPEAEPQADVSPQARAAAAERRRQRSEEAAAASWSVESVTDEAHQTARATRIRRTVPSEAMVQEPDPTVALLPETPSHRADAGAAWGTLIHGLLEHAARKPGASRQELERLARWLLVEHPDLRPFVAAAIDSVEAVMKAPFWAEARAGTCAVEVPFAIRLDPAPLSGPPPDQVAGGQVPRVRAPGGRVRARASGSAGPIQASLFDHAEAAVAGPGEAARGDAPEESRPTILRGVIDLAYRTDAGWRIVDYKTDQVVADVQELVARYGPQVARYREAWAQTTGAPVPRAGLFSVRRLEVVWMEQEP